MALKYQRNPLGRREPERLHPIPGLLDAWGQASSSWNNGEAEKVPVLGPPGAAHKISPGQGGKAVRSQRWSALLLCLPQQGDPQMAC